MTCLSLIHAQENMELQDFPHYVVDGRSQIFPVIEKAYIEIYKSNINESLCLSTGNALNLHYSMGLSPKTALEISDSCSLKSNAINKNFRRQYTVIFDSARKIPFDSWTNKTGMTYLVFDRSVNFEKLKLMLVHELAISLDSKYKMFATSYLKHQQDKKIALENSVSDAFFYSIRNDFAQSFAVSRANNFEKLYLGQKMLSLNSHEECIAEFKKNLVFTQNTGSNNFLKKPTDDLLGELLDKVDDADSSKFDGSNYELHLYEILSAGRKLNDDNLGQISFCQYMSHPMFLKHSYYSMLANGPRPRTGGGWGNKDNSKNLVKLNARVVNETDRMNVQDNISSVIEKDLLKLNTQQEKIPVQIYHTKPMDR